MSLKDHEDALENGRDSKLTPSESSFPHSPTKAGKSAGVLRIEAISSSFTKASKALLFAGIFLVAYSYGLDGQTRYVYQAVATNSYSTHSLLATLNVVKAVIAAASQPAYAKIADIFGRLELFIVALIFFVVGTAIEAGSKGVRQYAGGQVLYTLGITGIQLLIEVLVADVTSLRNRLFWSIFPAVPFIINTWISGNVTEAILTHATWQWGVGLWCIVLPVTSILIVGALLAARRNATKSGKLENLPPPLEGSSLSESAKLLFWRMDLLGLLFMSAALSLILIPLTIAGGVSARWHKADVIVMLVIGFIMIPVFVVWEMNYARHPILPFSLLRDRTIIGGLLVAVFLNWAWYMQGDYIYSVLVVAFDQSIESATRISSLYSFASVITSVILGLVVRHVRVIKPFQITGILLFTLALGLLVKYRGQHGAGTAGLIGAQVVLGIGGGLFAYPTQVMLQAATKHEHVAVITALYLTAYQIGSAFGSSVSAAVWTNTLPQALERNLGPINATLVAEAYGAPFTVIASYPMGTPERDAIVLSYNETQRLLCITAVCLCVPLLLAALGMRNPRLTDEQTLPEVEAAQHDE